MSNFLTKIRLLGIGTDEDSTKLREAEFHRAQHHNDVWKMKEETRTEIYKARTLARHERWTSIGTFLRSEYSEWGTTLRVVPVAMAVLVATLVWVMLAMTFPLVNILYGPSLTGYTIVQSTNGHDNWYIDYMPKGSGPDKWATYSLGMPKAKSQSLYSSLVVNNPAYEFRFRQDTENYTVCWKVEALYRFGSNVDVSPCYTSYSNTVAVYHAFTKSSFDSLPSEVLNEAVPEIVAPMLPSVAPKHSLTVVLVPGSMMEDAREMYPDDIGVEGPDYLLGLDPSEVVYIDPIR